LNRVRERERQDLRCGFPFGNAARKGILLQPDTI
jgi:hypothetical protein